MSYENVSNPSGMESILERVDVGCMRQVDRRRKGVQCSGGEGDGVRGRKERTRELVSSTAREMSDLTLTTA